jgi:NitT/TauT family transport system ATP-binding protein
MAAADQGPSGAIVETRGVSMVFPSTRSSGGVEALRDINLSVERGEFVSLIGPSGCGKSTLLRLVGDLLQPTDGEILVNGHTAHEARKRREYAMVFQAPVLFDWRTVSRNVALPLEVLHRPGKDRATRTKDMLKLVELDDFGGHSPWQLSGGMQQRVAIARAFSLDPAILLMDEPFGALDEMTRERMNLELHRLWEEMGTTIIFVTHSIPEAVFLSTRVVVMSPRPGRISDVVDIDLGRARTTETRESESYFSLVTRVRESLRAEEGRRPGYDRVRAEGLSA